MQKERPFRSKILRGIDVSLDLVLSSSSIRFLKKLKRDSHLLRRLVEAMLSLTNEPYPRNAMKVHGGEDNLMRIRVGDHRILYVVNAEKNELYISIIDKRSRAYRMLDVII